MAKQKFTVEADVKNPLDKKNIEAGLNKLASLDFDDRNLVSELMNNPKALKAIAQHKEMLLSMI